MLKKAPTAHRLDTIADMHRALHLPAPRHSLISLLNNASNQFGYQDFPAYDVLGFYKITCITKMGGRFRYGQGHYDFDEGSMLFTAPNQVVGTEYDQTSHAGYALLVHPDFLQGFPIAGKIRQYGFFSYSSQEALHLSEQERTTILSIIRILEEELNGRPDEFSQDVLIAQIDLLLSYANRFYKRQFRTRNAANAGLLQQLEESLNTYFDDEKTPGRGLPTVRYLAEHLKLSPRYLSDLLRALTGQNAQQHIHEKVLEKAREKLSTTPLSVSEVAYQLGFEHPQSFSKLFKTKTGLSPVAFKRSFRA